MTHQEFIEVASSIVRPIVEPHGFRPVARKAGWLAPTVLLESGNRWFSAEWDWRDQYLQVDLGRLYLFDDVMPRVIVHGASLVAEELDPSDVGAKLTWAAEQAVVGLEHFAKLLAASRARVTATPTAGTVSQRQRKATREFLRHLGTEISLAQWQDM